MRKSFVSLGVSALIAQIAEAQQGDEPQLFQPYRSAAFPVGHFGVPGNAALVRFRGAEVGAEIFDFTTYLKGGTCDYRERLD